MKTNKYYFEDNSSESCFTIDYFYDQLANNGLSEMEIYPAIIERGAGYFYCNEFGEVGESKECCGKLNCSKYTPRNGKNGICKHHRNCYTASLKSIKITLK